ncbi:MAG TPA: chemotaxis protein CheB [Desulfurivibrionaceae bacterium]|nr:chemotaxis protein CheB [Desulfurivibrionaceae bacterium]
MNQCVNILIVDDSRLIRNALKEILVAYPDIRVVGEAANGEEALAMIAALAPDVVVLDVNMPVMDGLTTLKHMMIQRPTPTVMLSTLTTEGAGVTFDAFKFGAVDFLTKPTSLNDRDIQAQGREIVDKIRIAAGVRMDSVQYIRAADRGNAAKAPVNGSPEKFIAIGAGEGGYSALLKLVPQLSPTSRAAYIVVLHEEPAYVDAFVAYLDRCSQLKVKRAEDNLVMAAATCYFCSGREYITIREKGGAILLHTGSAPFNSRRGSINMLMFSMVELLGDRSVGVVLTGGGFDGAEGLQEIIAHGGIGIIENPDHCLYKEMPEQALSRSPGTMVMADHRIATALNLCGV